MIARARAILLGKTKYGEADLILKMITSDGLVHSVIAKSALKSKKRFGGGVLEPTHYISLSMTGDLSGGSERLPVLNEAQLISDFRGLKADYDRIELALHMVKVVATVIREGDANKETFDLLGHSLRAAETSKRLPLLRIQFDLKLLHLQGVLASESNFSPFLRRSVSEHEEIVVADDDWRMARHQVDLVLQSYVG